MLHVVRMVQVAPNRWNLVSSKGSIISEDVPLGSIRDAENWVKNYITSFIGWSYEIIPLQRSAK